MEFPAHIKYLNNGEKKVQTVLEHCQCTAKYAGERLFPIGLSDAAYAAGFFHDLGKCAKKSLEYQEAAARGEDVVKGSVIHTFQGCRMLLEDHAETPTDFMDVSRELLAFAVGSHHGLFDCYDDSHRSGFLHRIVSEECDYAEAKENFLTDCGGKKVVEEIFCSAHQSLEPVYAQIQNLTTKGKSQDEELHFYMGLLERLITSAVIDGDRRDTAEFMNGTKGNAFPTDMSPIWDERLQHAEKKIREFQADTPIKKARSQISERCRKAAEAESGIFRLNVPTGGGKTLSSLRFSLAHAKKWNKKRIIFTAPLLSIIDQNAAVLREFIGDNSLILEHHSDVMQQDAGTELLNDRELLMDNWDAPIIITTMVQLLNTMFAGKTSSIRRFCSLADSIIVIDEVQTIPDKMLSLFNLTINFLTEICKATVVLCSATQPALGSAQRPMREGARDIVPFDNELWSVFSRTEIRPEEKAMPLQNIPEYVHEKLQETNSLLVVCNKRAEAEYLYRSMTNQDMTLFHLSASMCMQHRRDTLRAIGEALKESHHGGNRVLCISTQVIEAGVDISFGCVIRFAAGLESIVQAAGRCNRNGESEELAPVYVVNCSDEKLGPLREIQSAKTAAIELFYEYIRAPDRFHRDLTSDAAIEYYYKKLYGAQPVGHQDFMISDRRVSLFSMLSDNRTYADKSSEHHGNFFMNQAFRTSGKLFQVFENDSETIVVPYGKGRDLIEELLSEGEHAGQLFLKSWLNAVKPYTVSIYDYQKKQLQKSGGIYSVAGIYILQPFNYDDEVGLMIQKENMDFWEV